MVVLSLPSAAPGCAVHHRPDNTYITLCCSRALPWLHVHAGFYSGRVAEAIVQALQERGGVLSAQDLADHRSEITDPICSTYRNHTIYEVPPPTAVSTDRWTSFSCLCCCELGRRCCNLHALPTDETLWGAVSCFCLCLRKLGRLCYVWATTCRHCTLSALPAIWTCKLCCLCHWYLT